MEMREKETLMMKWEDPDMLMTRDEALVMAVESGLHAMNATGIEPVSFEYRDGAWHGEFKAWRPEMEVKIKCTGCQAWMDLGDRAAYDYVLERGINIVKCVNCLPFFRQLDKIDELVEEANGVDDDS